MAEDYQGIMLSIHIITVGRDKEHWITDQIEHYRKLIRKYARLELTTVPEVKYKKGMDIEKALDSEAVLIETKLRGGYIYILDAGGNTLSTEQFAAKMAKLQVEGHSLLEFIIGGPYGLSSNFKSKMEKSRLPSRRLSLSPLTMSHQIVRLVLLEQLYRMLNINAGGSYHK